MVEAETSTKFLVESMSGNLIKTNESNGSKPTTRLLGGSKSVDDNTNNIKPGYGFSGTNISMKGAIAGDDRDTLASNDAIPKVSLSSPNAAELLRRIEEMDDNLHLHKKSIDLATHGMLWMLSVMDGI